MNKLRNNCTWEWTTQNGVNGYKVIGTNENTIFIPAAGYRSGSSLYNEGYYGGYWSSTPGDYGDVNGAYGLYFASDGELVGYNGRDYGHTVCPITE